MPVPKIPKSRCVITGEHAPYKTIDDFFQNIIFYIGLDKTRPPQTQFEIKRLAHTREKDRGELEDKTHYLVYRKKGFGQRVVACVTEIRNDWNYVQFSYFMDLQNIAEGENLPGNS